MTDTLGPAKVGREGVQAPTATIYSGLKFADTAKPSGGHTSLSTTDVAITIGAMPAGLTGIVVRVWVESAAALGTAIRSRVASSFSDDTGTGATDYSPGNPATKVHTIGIQAMNTQSKTLYLRAESGSDGVVFYEIDCLGAGA